MSMRLSPKQQTLAIAAGLVGALYDMGSNRILIQSNGGGVIGWDSDGKFFVDLSMVMQNDKWKSYYTSKMLAVHDAATKIVQAILKSRGKSL